MNKALETSILQTLAYFDQFNRPLSELELFSFLWKAPAAVSHNAFQAALKGGIEGVSSGDGFYFLNGREVIVSQYKKTLAVSKQKIVRARLATSLITWIPFLEAVFVCNTVASGTATPESDIDLFIVARTGYLWFVRFMTVAILQLAGLRRHGMHITDQMCLSFYIDTDHLDVKPLTLNGDDIYFAYWLAELVPLYDRTHIQESLFKENGWMNAVLPHVSSEGRKYSAPTPMRVQLFKKILEFGLSLGGRMLEAFCKKIQLKKIYQSSEGKHRTLSTAVVISDGVLKFHETDRREEYRKRWQEKVSQLESTATYV